MTGRRAAACALVLCSLSAAAVAATPTPRPSGHASKPPARIDLTKVQPKALLPKKPEHAEYVVDVNKLGQVSRIESGKTSDNRTFNAQTYGNALQTFIRTPDGQVIVGKYRLTYDFDPKTARVRRDVTLLRAGGVDPNARGAALELIDEAKTSPGTPNPQISIDPHSLPDLNGITVPTPLPRPS